LPTAANVEIIVGDSQDLDIVQLIGLPPSFPMQ
jgi:hypothetical protein